MRGAVVENQMNELSQQIDAGLNVFERAKDQPLTGNDLFESVRDAVLSRCPDADVATTRFGNHKYLKIVFPNGTSHSLLLSAVTFLGGNHDHPTFKKRIQLKTWYKDAWLKLSNQTTVHFLGVYHFRNNIVFVDFDPNTYIKRKMHNSSAFVYINDLYRGMKDLVAERIDFHGNRISTIHRLVFADYLLSQADDSRRKTDAQSINVFQSFNEEFPFCQWISGLNAYPEMKDANWSKWQETEWPGWYLEFLFANYLKDNKIDCIQYHGNLGKKKGGLDFDLWFPFQHMFGDLKASDEKKNGTPGNDQRSFLEALNKFDRFWYVIYEHQTIKDSKRGGEVARKRVELAAIAKNDDSYRILHEGSYAERMKHSINFKRMMVVEINRANCNLILKNFNQGRQPDGSVRAPKFLINKRNIENFQIYHYEGK